MCWCVFGVECRYAVSTYRKLFPLPLTITGQVACFFVKAINFSLPSYQLRSLVFG